TDAWVFWFPGRGKNHPSLLVPARGTPRRSRGGDPVAGTQLLGRGSRFRGNERSVAVRISRTERDRLVERAHGLLSAAFSTVGGAPEQILKRLAHRTSRRPLPRIRERCR